MARYNYILSNSREPQVKKYLVYHLVDRHKVYQVSKMRLSSGITLTYGSDYLGIAILVESALDSRRVTNMEEWKLDKATNLDSSKRCWRLSRGKSIERTTNQCPPDFLNVLIREIDKLSTSQVHPALIDGLESEAKRLLPNISADANNKFQEFLALLNSEFNFNISSTKGENMVPFVDDIGPNLLTLIDQKPVILPEIPPVYLAPSEWRLSMWRVNNYMIGPLLIDELSDNEQIRFDGLSIPKKELTPEAKGLFYFHMARFILFFEAWQRSSDALYLQEFIRLFKGGIRPLESLIRS
jgi:hypothetical protein